MFMENYTGLSKMERMCLNFTHDGDGDNDRNMVPCTTL